MQDMYQGIVDSTFNCSKLLSSRGSSSHSHDITKSISEYIALSSRTHSSLRTPTKHFHQSTLSSATSFEVYETVSNGRRVYSRLCFAQLSCCLIKTKNNGKRVRTSSFDVLCSDLESKLSVRLITLLVAARPFTFRQASVICKGNLIQTDNIVNTLDVVL